MKRKATSFASSRENAAEDVAAEERGRARGRVDDCDLVPALAQEVGKHERRHVIVLRHYHNPPTRLSTREDGPDVQHLLAIGARHIRTARLGPGRDGDDISAKRHNLIRRSAVPGAHAHAHSLEVSFLPREVVREVVIARRGERLTQLPTEPVARFPELHVVPPLASERGRLTARNGPSTSLPACGFTARPNGKPSMSRRLMYSLPATHGRASPARPARVTEQVGVGDVCMRHADDICLAPLEHGFRHLDRGHAAGVHNR
jgi:hypothetical protein